jgi:peptidyl-prolyl cis-trans isomerase SurA
VMSRIPTPGYRRALTVAMLAAVIVLAVPPTAHSQQVVALVDGVPITALDIEQRTKFVQMSTNKVPPRQEVLDGLIDEILEVREAKKFSIDVPDSEVDNAFANVGKRMGADPQKLTEILTKGGASADTLKHRPRLYAGVSRQAWKSRTATSKRNYNSTSLTSPTSPTTKPT